ncbi:IKS protein kinase [Microbotryum lychnidis-dioicae p1A1 Lamole]|uniref:IKS protein kinase n=1 Tax=Microbotryum lychnidis-dioicae (strain p1A1 Lamole / MvSl-1064) TaxID=683840 RepID=U5H2R6_USTV1|nr:IKS protein kinase [Microbotryum lychnidis-dioicae p1A1 Lamole]|eukprot:KDE08169.1 IKS protein kinase [Microbotryum lychnidis-dioicae p1A1 Lamole]
MAPVASTSKALVYSSSPSSSSSHATEPTASPATTDSTGPLALGEPEPADGTDVDDHRSWQVVLVTPQKKLVIYNTHRNSLHVASTRQWAEAPDDAETVVWDDEEGVEHFHRTDDDEDDVEESGQVRAKPTLTTTRKTTRSRSSKIGTVCPLCHRLFTSDPRGKRDDLGRANATTASGAQFRFGQHHATEPRLDLIQGRDARKNSSYFALLSHANSRTNSPRVTAASASARAEQADQQSGGSATPDGTERLQNSTLNTGYFESFFEPLQLLGKGGAGSVWLVRHVLNGEALGLYACKKVAVGNSAPSLLLILREVHLLEAVQHPNIVTYHHAWVESAQLSLYSPPVPTLHILMGYANGGSLASFIDRRRGSSSSPEDGTGESPAQRKERHRLRKLGAVHLLRVDEIVHLARDVTMGLGFLHQRNILHLDLKAENVLLHWEEDALLPIAKLSDFGNATSDKWNRERTGGSGTLMYTAPEAFELDSRGRLHTADRATDQWALGLIFHLMSFFTLPYRNQDDTKKLEEEIKAYPGFFPHDALTLDHGNRHDLPVSLLFLTSCLIHRLPGERPSCERVLVALGEIDRGDGDDDAQVNDGHASAQLGLVKSLTPPSKTPIGIMPRRKLLSGPSSQLISVDLASTKQIGQQVQQPSVVELSQRSALGVIAFQALSLALLSSPSSYFSIRQVLAIVAGVLTEVLVPRAAVFVGVSLLGGLVVRGW